jgi:O-antigen/teichoic acid export membrane protein
MFIKVKTNQFIALASSATFRQSALTISTIGVNGILGALFFIYIARMMGPAEYGLFTIGIATLTLLADIADFGTNTGLVRFVPGYLKQDPSNAYRMLKLGLEVKACLWLVVLLAGFLLAPFFATNIFGKPELLFPFQLSLIGVGGAMFYTYIQSALQAFEKFRYWSLINIFTNGLRLSIALFIGLLASLGLTQTLLIYIGIPFVGFLLGCSFLPIKKIIKTKNEQKVLNNFISYNSYIGLFTIIAAVTTRIDVYLAAKFLNPEQVGIYGAAIQLTSFIPQIMGGLGVVVAPKFASFTSQAQMWVYFKKLQLLVLGVAAIFLIGSPLAGYLIPIFYGDKFAFLPTIFYFYLTAMLVYLISVPVHTVIFYYFARPQLFIYISLGHLILLLGLGTVLTINFGLIGLTLAVIAGMVFIFASASLKHKKAEPRD